MFDDADPDKRGGKDNYSICIINDLFTNNFSNYLRGSDKPVDQAWRSARKSQHQVDIIKFSLNRLIIDFKISSIDRWLVPGQQEAHMKDARHLNRLPHQLSAPYIKNNSIYLIFVIIFTLVNVTLFITRAIQYRKSNFSVIFARACGELFHNFLELFNESFLSGQCLNFDCAFVLVLMLRHTLTYLRTRGLSAVLPLDQHIYLHKLTGWLIVTFGIWHTFMHIINFSES